jgi:hypothetical protein
MKTMLILSLLCGSICLAGCIQRFHTEQRVVELPADDPKTSVETAAQIGQALINGGFGADVQKQFPTLSSPEQWQGLYLTWNVAIFQGKGRKSVFFLTGIRYTGEFPEAKAIADYCELRVKEAVAAKFSTPKSDKAENKGKKQEKKVGTGNL